MISNTGISNTLGKFCPRVTLFTVNPRRAALTVWRLTTHIWVVPHR